jgi:hypothetical protein
MARGGDHDTQISAVSGFPNGHKMLYDPLTKFDRWR